MERSPGQDGDVVVGNLVDQRHGSPITIGYGRYGPNQTLEETMAVDDVMVVLEGRLSVSANAESVTAGPGEIVPMRKGRKVTIRSHEQGALTTYVTCPHWQEARVQVPQATAQARSEAFAALTLQARTPHQSLSSDQSTRKPTTVFPHIA